MADRKTEILLSVRNLQVNFGPVIAVNNIDLDIPKGKIVGLVGESGSGKSTLAMAIIGLLANSATIARGSIKFDGTDLLKLNAKQWQALRGQKISLVSQDSMSALNPVLTIGEQMAVIQYREKIGVKDKWGRALQALEQVKLPEPAERMRMYPHQLSGGQKQRVAIAMALMSNPQLLIADEPTTALDATLEVQIIGLLKDLQHEIGCSIIFVTHHLGVVASLCDEVAVMYDGNIREAGAVKDVFRDPQDDYTRRLLQCDPARIHVKCRKLPTMAAPELVIPADSTADARRIDKSKLPLLSIRELDVSFRKPFSLSLLFRKPQAREIKAVKSVSFDVWPGETVALVGESGSGKTTLARAIMRLVKINAGSIVLDGNDLASDLSQNLYRNVAMMFQDPIGSLSPRMTIGSLVIEPLKVHKIPLPDRQGRAQDLLDMVGLDPEFTNRYPHELSGGQARRVGVARALALSPRLIVADEPTAGLDVSVQGEILNLFADLQDKLGLSILIITHNLNVVRHISDRMVIMYMGEIIEQGRTEEIFDNPQHDYTRKLLAANIHPDLL